MAMIKGQLGRTTNLSDRVSRERRLGDKPCLKKEGVSADCLYLLLQLQMGQLLYLLLQLQRGQPAGPSVSKEGRPGLLAEYGSQLPVILLYLLSVYR